MKTLNPRTDPRECLFRLGNNIRKLINKALNQNHENNNDIKEAIDCLQNAVQTEDNNKQLIDYETLSLIHKYLQRIDANYNLYFYQLLDECRVVLPQTRKVFISLIFIFINNFYLIIQLFNRKERRIGEEINSIEMQ
jgi:hypothetical protein